MVGAYKRHDGVKLPLTRIGSTVTLIGENNFNIENNVYIGQYNFIEATNGITIKEGCQITNFISIITHSSHKSIRLYGKHYTKVSDKIAYGKGSVTIGKFTFVGPHSVIMPNTVIGKGSIVSAYSYVQGEFPDYSIIGGNPAQVIGDTRELDKPYLDKHSELKGYYDEWTASK